MNINKEINVTLFSNNTLLIKEYGGNYLYRQSIHIYYVVGIVDGKYKYTVRKGDYFFKVI